MPEGAPILGSKVSVCGGPPCMKRKTTDFPVRRLSGAAALAAARSARERPPRARLPTLRKSRRLQPGSRKLSMVPVSPGYSTRTKRETARASPAYSFLEDHHADTTRDPESRGPRRRRPRPARLGPRGGKDPARRGVLFAAQLQAAPGHRDGEGLRNDLRQPQVDASPL